MTKERHQNTVCAKHAKSSCTAAQQQILTNALSFYMTTVYKKTVSFILIE